MRYMIQKCECGAPIGPLWVGKNRPTQCYECRKISKSLAAAAEKIAKREPPTPLDHE